MAGVSLPLRRLLGSRSYLGQFVAYLYAGLAMTGPWLLTALALVLLNAADFAGAPQPEREVFQAVALYGYFGSMVLTGIVQLGVARYLSDEVFLGRVERIRPTFAAAGLASLALHVAVAGAFVAATRPGLHLGLAEVAFFGSLGLVWIGMLFLGLVRNFIYIVASFVVGLAAGGILAFRLAPTLGAAGLTWAFAAAHALVAALLAARIRTEFPSDRAPDYGFLRMMLRYPELPALGVVWAAATWADKVVFWAGPYGWTVAPGLSTFPLYDNSVYLAYLTTVPALVLLFIRLEVSFYERFRAFDDALRNGAPLAKVREARHSLQEAFEETLKRVVVLQAPLTLAVIVLAPQILGALGIDWIQYYLFRVACAGAFLHVVALAVLLTLLHLGFYVRALVMAAVFCAATTAATVWAMGRGLELFPFGYPLGAAAALVAGYVLLVRALPRLEFRLLTAQRF